MIRFCSLAIFSILFAACANSPPIALPLAEFEGLYEYESGTTLVMVAGPDRHLLYADINGARYPLRPHRSDVFLNAGDVEVEFARSDDGGIIGYREKRSESFDENPLFALLDSEVRRPASIWIAKPETNTTPYIYRAPANLSDGLPVAALTLGGPLATHLSAMTNAIYDNAYPGVQAALVYKDGALVFEEYFYEYDIDKRHQLRSATKTLIALLAGVAVDQGLIASIDTPILSYFDEYDDLKFLDDRKRSITIRDLLTMQSGLDCNDWDEDSPGNESKMVYAEDWARFILDTPMLIEPGEVGSYCTGNTILVGRIIEKVTGRPLKAFANDTLFGPLGVSDYEWDFHPDRSNINNFVQAWLRPRDMLKIGILIASDGMWNGRRIVSEKWIRDMGSTHSTIRGTPYGYFFWRRFLVFEGRRIETPQISGNGGQKIILLDDDDTILVLTGGNYNQSSYANDLLAEFVLPGLAD